MRILLLLAMLVSSSARADYSKAWAAAKANLPATTRAVAMIDATAFDKSPHFQRIYKLALTADRDVREFEAEVKQLCKLDLAKTLEGVVVAGDPEKNQLVLYVQLAVDRAKATACFEALIAKKAGSGPKPTMRQEGMYTVMMSRSGQREIFVAWPAPNVLAFTFDPQNKPALAAWVGREGFAKSPVAPQIAKADPKAIAAGAVALSRPLDDMISSAYGQLVMAGERLSAVVVGNTTDANAATKGGAQLTKEIEREKSRKHLAPAIRTLLSNMRVGAKGTDIRLEAAGTVKDLADAFEAEMTRHAQPVEPPAPPRP
jgi:hypothetical protein